MKVLVMRWWWGQKPPEPLHPTPLQVFVTHLRGEELDKILLMTEHFE